MLTICLPSRKKGNLSSSLNGLLDSIVNHSTAEELSNVEVIVKFDDDDEVPGYVVNNQYPFPVKYVQYTRGCGRWDLHNFLNYLADLRDPRCSFIMNTSDDFLIKRPFISEILSIKDKYAIIGGATRGRGDQRGGDALPFLDDNISIPLGVDYRNKYGWHHCVAHYCPIFSSKMIDVMGMYSFIPSIDAFAICLALCMYNKYNINIWHDITSFYYRNESTAYYHPSMTIIPEYHHGISPYNKLDIITYHDANPFFYKKIEQLVDNIYLNMKADNEQAKTN